MLHLFNFLHWVFARGRERSTRAFYVHILDICRNAYLRGSGDWEEQRGQKKRSRARGPVKLLLRVSGSGHAARAHMESGLNSSADSNCPSVVSLEKHVSRQRRLAARARYQSWSWFAPSKREARRKPAVRARVTVSTYAGIGWSRAQMAFDMNF